MRNLSRKLTALLLSVLMLLSIVPTTVFAAKNPFDKTVGEAQFSVSSSFSATEGTTKIFVDISGDYQMSAGLFALKYDTSLVKALNVEIGVVLKDGYTAKNITSNGEVKVSYADVNPNYDEGRLFEVEFEIVGNIPEGKEYIDVPVTLEVLQLKNYEDYNIAYTVSNGKITVIDTCYGDVNKSGETTASDALMVLYANSQLLTFTQEQNLLADVNGDGKVTASDALLILQYSAGHISNYPLFEVAVPSNIKVKDKDETSVTLTWDEIKNIKGYNIFMDGSKVNAELVTENSYTVSGLLQDTKHTFEVQAVNVLMASAKSLPLVVSTNKADRIVTFKNYDGSILDTQVVLSGESSTPPEIPARKGYTFIGWDSDTDCITADITITALYKINTYTVRFDYLYNGIASSKEYDYNSNIAKPALIERSNYTLEGWYLDKNFTKKWNFDTNKIENDIVLYANWVTWSEWTTDTTLLNNAAYEVESKTQYSYSDKSTKSSTSSSLSGWSPSGSKTTYGSWTNVGWTKTKPTTSDTLQITSEKTVIDYTNYNLYYYRYWNSSAGSYYYTYSSSMGGTYYSKTVKSTEVTHSGTYSGHKGYYINDKSNRYFANELWFVKSTSDVTHKEWYYQTRTKTITYDYYKWSPYSDWSDVACTASDTRQVKTQTVYRYKLKQQ